MKWSKRFRDRLGANGPGLTVAVIALIFALAGGAFAASGGLSGKQKKETEKIAKKFAGKAGANGAAGPAGSQGSPGAKGDKGDAGNQGPAGKSVKVTAITAGGSACEGRSGTLVKEEGAPTGVEVCEGSPWTAGGTLPSGAMETGAFSVQGSSEDAGDTANGLFTSISFPIPLPEPIDAAHVITLPTFPPPDGCKDAQGEVGTVEEPVAEPGFLCIYSGGELAGTFIEKVERPGSIFAEEGGASTTGARLRFEVPTEPFAIANGSFAVTAP